MTTTTSPTRPGRARRLGRLAAATSLAVAATTATVPVGEASTSAGRAAVPATAALATATYPVVGGIAVTYNRLGGAGGWLGLPTGRERATRSRISPAYAAWRQDFQRGVITFSDAPGIGGHGVYTPGAIGSVWVRGGSEASPYGLPLGEEVRGSVWGTYLQHFERGGIFWSAATGAQHVDGAILAAYRNLGAESSRIGLPTGPMTSSATGWTQAFRYGRITFSRTGQLSITETPDAAGPGFNASSRQTVAADVPLSYRPGCPVGPTSLRTIQMNHWGFDGRVHAGTMVVHADVAAQVVESFAIAYQSKFPIRQMRDPSAFNNDDWASMRADNTYAFSCRQVTGTPGTMSPHSYGRSIDINTVENPYRVNGIWYPENGRAYVDRSIVRAGMLYASTPLTQALRARGWTWYEGWDYQHFNR